MSIRIPQILVVALAIGCLSGCVNASHSHQNLACAPDAPPPPTISTPTEPLTTTPPHDSALTPPDSDAATESPGTTALLPITWHPDRAEIQTTSPLRWASVKPTEWIPPAAPVIVVTPDFTLHPHFYFDKQWTVIAVWTVESHRRR